MLEAMPQRPRRKWLQRRGTVVAAVASSGYLAVGSAAALAIRPSLSATSSLGVKSADRSTGSSFRAPRQQRVLAPHLQRQVVSHALQRNAFRPLSAFLSGAEAPFNDGDLDTLVQELDVEEEEWPVRDDILQTIEELQKEDDRRKMHAQQSGHVPVQEADAVDYLLQSGSQDSTGKYDGIFIDGTFGRGGHSRSILEKLTSSGRLYAFDVDPVAIEAGRRLEQEDPRFRIFHRPFGELQEALQGMPINGILLDIGVSNPKADEFRATSDGPFDLRMNHHHGLSAMEWLQNVSVEELAWVINEYGERNSLMSERIAEAILDRQARFGPYTTSGEVSEVVKQVKGANHFYPFHPAKLTFQAIRIHLNHEIEQLKKALEGAFDLLSPGGRCVVLTFKNLELDAVTNFVQAHEEPPPELVKRLQTSRLCELYPMVESNVDYSVRFVHGISRPRGTEMEKNPRSKFSTLVTMQKAKRTAQRVHHAPTRTVPERLSKADPPSFQGASPMAV